MFVILSTQDTDKLLVPYVFNTEQEANNYAKEWFFSGITVIMPITLYSDLHCIIVDFQDVIDWAIVSKDDAVGKEIVFTGTQEQCKALYRERLEEDAINRDRQEASNEQELAEADYWDGDESDKFAQ